MNLYYHSAGDVFAFSLTLVVFVVIFIITLLHCKRSFGFFGSIFRMVSNILFVMCLLTMIASAAHCLSLAALIAFGERSTTALQFQSTLMRTLIYNAIYTLFYACLTLRVYIAFRTDAEYRISPTKMIFIIIILLIIPSVPLFAAFEKKYESSTKFYLQCGNNVSMILFNFFLLYLFLKRLRKMIINLQSAVEEIMDIDDGEHKQKKTINTIASTNDSNPNDSLNEYSLLSGGVSGDAGGVNVDVDGNSSSTNTSDTVTMSNRRKFLSSSYYYNYSYQVTRKLKRNKKQQMEIINLMAKISLLTVVEQVLYVLWVVLRVIWHIMCCVLDYGYTANQSIIVWLLYESVMTINVCFICTVLYFMFAFNNDHYELCCIKCHSCFTNCCVKIVH